MYFLIEKDEAGAVVTRYNMDTDKGLTKAKLIQLLKLACDHPGRWEVVRDGDFIHPSEGHAPAEHMDISDMVVEWRHEIDAIGYPLDKSDFARIAILVSQRFKATYHTPPRSISRPLKNNPQVWAGRKQAYPPGPFIEIARQEILVYCADRKVKLGDDLARTQRLSQTDRDLPSRPGIPG
jgi:hypothetical protein